MLNAKQYPAIKDNTLNMIVPGHPQQDYQKLEQDAIKKMAVACGGKQGCLPDNLTVKKLKHLRNGPFVLFQTDI
ncbi:hypothetical protein [Candidatus Spongiihabitans sp.]|uniref:hypothetical protein n=1 Tax=Candidatus Spongiihabitans sp. TaxID=3101308 RepID=UPI003C6F4B43